MVMRSVCRYKLSNGPWTLGQVCAQWRETAKANHHLWSTVVLRRSSFATSEIGPLLRVLEAGLERSCTSLLTLEIDLGAEIDDPHTTASIIQVFFSHSTRWYRAAISFAVDGCYIIRNMTASFPALHRLGLRLHSHFTDEESASEFGTIKCFSTCSELRIVEIEGINFPGAINLPWQLLTHIRAVSTPCVQLHPLTVLRRCTNIISLDVDFSFQFFLPSTTSVVTNLTLQHLSIATYFWQIFPKISLPNLQSLNLGYSAKESSLTVSIAAPLGEMLTRSECTLQRMTFSYSFVHRDIIPILSLPAMNQLQELVLDLDQDLNTNDDHDWFLSFLTLLIISRSVDPETGLPAPMKLPRLRTLKIRARTPIGETTCEDWDDIESPGHACVRWIGPELFDMLESRLLPREFNHSSNLEEMDVKLGFVAHLPYWHKETERIQRMKKLGLKFTLTFSRDHRWPYESGEIEPSWKS
jgi:hypothetical protein